jgi:hypothetical protein
MWRHSFVVYPFPLSHTHVLLWGYTCGYLMRLTGTFCPLWNLSSSIVIVFLHHSHTCEWFREFITLFWWVCCGIISLKFELVQAKSLVEEFLSQIRKLLIWGKHILYFFLLRTAKEIPAVQKTLFMHSLFVQQDSSTWFLNYPNFSGSVNLAKFWGLNGCL